MAENKQWKLQLNFVCMEKMERLDYQHLMEMTLKTQLIEDQEIVTQVAQKDKKVEKTVNKLKL